MSDPDDDDAVVVALYPALRRFAAMVAPWEMEPDDLVQEVLTATLARGALVDLDDPLTYLRVAMMRRSANERRRLGRKRRATSRVGSPTVAGATYPSDLADLVRLAPEDRALLYLTTVEGRSIADAARVLGASVGALKMRRHRALRRLRVELEEELRD